MLSSFTDFKAKVVAKEKPIISFLCSGIVVGLIFWTLLLNFSFILLFVYWLLFAKKTFEWKYNFKWVLLFSTLFIITVISSFYSANLEVAFSRLERRLPILIFPLIFGTTDLITARNYKRICNQLSWFTAIACLICIGNALYLVARTGEQHILYGYEIVILKGTYPYIFGLCCLLSLIIVVFKYHEIIVKNKGFIFKWPSILMMGIFVVFILLLGNRSLFILLGMFSLFMIWKIFPDIKLRLVSFVFLIILLLLAIIYNPTLNRQWNEMTDFSNANTIQLDQDQSLGRSWGGKSLRIAFWKCSWDIIKRNSLLGVGIGDVQDELQKSYEQRKFYFASRYNNYNAHNQYVQEAVGQGFLGLLLFLLCIILPLFGISDKHNLIYILFLFSFSFICITESILETNKGVIWYAFFNSFFFFKK